jgi:hypothetical protein
MRTLEVGAATESGHGQAPRPRCLKTESGEVSHQIDYTDANNIPIFSLNGSGSEGMGNVRDPLSVLNTLPGANFTSDVEVRVNGLPSGSQAIRVEGQDSTNGFHAKCEPGNPAKCGRHSGSVRSRPAISRLSTARLAVDTSTTL